jgi:adenosylhomocysteine nucleosidase
MRPVREMVDTMFAFATAMEAQPLIDRLAATRCVDDGYPVYRCTARESCPATLIVITGIGLARAAEVTAEVLRNVRVRFVVNAGIAGALRPQYSVGALVRVSAVAEVSDDPRDTAVFRALSATSVGWLPRALAVGRLISRASPLFDPVQAAAFGTYADLVDMEGAAIARECARLRVPCALLKAVSDHAEDRATLHRNLKFASQQLAQFIALHYPHPALQESEHERSCSNLG